MAATLERTGLLTVRMNVEEMNMLKALAESDGISASDLVRQFVRRSFMERFGPMPKVAKKAKR